MMHFELKINGREITKFSARRTRTEVIDDVAHGVYEWESWRPSEDSPHGMDEYTRHEVAHLPRDGIEELALRILEDWSALRTAERYANSPAARVVERVAAGHPDDGVRGST